MSIQEWAAIAEIVGAVAVVESLVQQRVKMFDNSSEQDSAEGQ